MFEESACQKQIVCLTTSFAFPFRKDKVKVTHAKINHIFSGKKAASTEQHGYPINLTGHFFS